MDVRNIALSGLVLLLSASCARKEDKKAESDVGDNGLPVAVSDILLGDSCCIDTLYAGDGKVYMLIDNQDYMQKIIFDTNGLIVNNPTLTVDSLTATSYRIGDLLGSTVVDFSIEENVETLRKIFPVYGDFKTVTYGTAQSKPVNTIFSMSVSSPDEKLKHSADIRRWVASELLEDMDSVKFNGSFESLGKLLVRYMNEGLEGSYGAYPMYEAYSSLVYWMTDAYVTYFYSYSSFLGGAHGMYGYKFPTYLIQAGRPLTFDYMFLPEYANEIRELIYESFLTNTDFTSNHNINSVSQVKSYINADLMGDALPIPDPGLVEGGVVFCYQPYEIGCFADGAFQQVIPYEKLKPYMTDEGKKLIK